MMMIMIMAMIPIILLIIIFVCLFRKKICSIIKEKISSKEEKNKEKEEKNDEDNIISKNLKILKSSGIKEKDVNKILNDLEKEKVDDIYNQLFNMKVEELLSIKGALMKISEVNKEVSDVLKVAFFTLLCNIILNFYSSVFSNYAIKQIKFNIPFIEPTFKIIDESAINGFLFILVVIFIVAALPWLLSASNQELYSVSIKLINMIDYLVELNKELDKENKVIAKGNKVIAKGNKENINIIETEMFEVTKTTENKARKETLTTKLINKKAPVENN